MSPVVTEPPAPAAGWTGAACSFSPASLAPVAQLNAYFLETLTQCARHPAWGGSAWETALGPDLANALPAIQQELSRSPVSLVDMGLSDEAPRSFLTCGGQGGAHAPPAFLARDRAVELAQVSLSLAWTLARNDLVSTSIVFGVSRSRAKEIGALAVHSIPAISEKLSSAVRPRWLRHPRIWRHLLRSAEHSAGSLLAPMYVRILQRQFADLSPATSATHPLRDSRP